LRMVAMKAQVYSAGGAKSREVELPKVFDSVVRTDLISRAVLHEASLTRQPKGAYKLAGMQTTAGMRGRKEAYRAIKNKGISRVPREKLPKGRFGRVRIVPFAVGGRRAHPPNPEKILVEKMNGKEYGLALRSAIAATASAGLSKARGYASISPVVLEDAFEAIAKTGELEALFGKIGLGPEIERVVRGTRIKSGVRAKRSGSKKVPRGILVVVSGPEAKAARAARNLPGVDVCTPKSLTVSLLAPGCAPGRLTVWSEGALKEVSGW